MAVKISITFIKAVRKIPEAKNNNTTVPELWYNE